MPPEYTLIGLIIAAVSGAIGSIVTYFLKRPSSRADAFATMENSNASLAARVDVMSASMFSVQTVNASLQTENGLQKVSLERYKFEMEQIKADLLVSNRGWSDSRQLSDKLLIEIDGMPAKILKQAAEILRLEQERDGLPDVPDKPDPKLSALAADVAAAENRVGQSHTDGTLKIGDTVVLAEADG